VTPKAKQSPLKVHVRSENNSIDISQIHNDLQSQLKNYESPVKQSLEIRDSLEQIERHSPDYKLKKFNNYNNGIKNAQRNVLENFDLDTSLKVPPPKFMVSFDIFVKFFSKRKIKN
jgi:hypothetical protein